MLPDTTSNEMSIQQIRSPRDGSPVVRKGRPVGVTLLSLLHLIGGIGLLFLLPGLISQSGALQRAGETVGISGLAIIAGYAFLAAVSLAAGIGLWKGSRWGWWIGAFYYVYAIVRNISALITITGMADELAQRGGRGLPYYVVKHSARIAIHFLILVYFFRTNVLDFFGLSDISRRAAVAKLFGVCVALSVVATLVSLLAS